MDSIFFGPYTTNVVLKSPVVVVVVVVVVKSSNLQIFKSSCKLISLLKILEKKVFLIDFVRFCESNPHVLSVKSPSKRWFSRSNEALPL